MTRLLLAAALIAWASPTLARPLTIAVGETWMFRIGKGQPVAAHKAAATAVPAKGEVKVAVRALFGTTMTITSNSRVGYTFKAEVIGADGKAAPARSCTLPPDNQPALETWPQTARAVRIGAFKAAKGGRC